jgi:hypothetical protein
MQDGSHITHICRQEKYTHGAHAVWVKQIQAVMVHAMPTWQDAGQWHSTYLRADILSCATARILLTHLSAMELIETWFEPTINLTEDSGRSGVTEHTCLVSGICTGIGIHERIDNLKNKFCLYYFYQWNKFMMIQWFHLDHYTY